MTTYGFDARDSRGALRPYSRFARLYDATLGVESFRHARRAFEAAVRRYDIRFRSAADLGCGTGLFARYLARRWGVPVIAVDRSGDMLRVALRNGRCGGVLYSRQDIRELALPRPVDLVTANFDTVNHVLNRCELRRAFSRILANLTPGGHFVFDAITNCAPLGGRRLYVRRYRLVRWEVTQRIHWDPARRRITGFVIQRGPDARDRSVEQHRERAYSPAELGAALQDAGFVIRAVLDALTLKPALSCPPRALIVAVRPPGFRAAVARGLSPAQSLARIGGAGWLCRARLRERSADQLLWGGRPVRRCHEDPKALGTAGATLGVAGCPPRRRPKSENPWGRKGDRSCPTLTP